MVNWTSEKRRGLIHAASMIICAFVTLSANAEDGCVPGGLETAMYPAADGASNAARGDRFLREGDPESAVSCFELAHALEDGDAIGSSRILLLLGEALEEAGKREEALKAFQYASKRSSEGLGSQLALSARESILAR